MTQRQANLILATVSLAWGASYIFMKLVVDEDPSNNDCRFTIWHCVYRYGSNILQKSNPRRC